MKNYSCEKGNRMDTFFDVHCHILPGVDDGAESMEEAIALLYNEYDDGVRTVYLTPHNRKGMFECNADVIKHQFELLKNKAQKVLPDLLLKLGYEIYVGMDIVEQLNAGLILTMDNTRLVLVEFAVDVEKRYIMERCYDMLRNGYIPIIAHVERCIIIRKEIKLLQQLVDMGVMIQINAGSIIGDEGLAMKMFCKKVMKKDLLHFIGSDAHDLIQRKPNMGRCAEYIVKTMGKDYQEKILINNPCEIIGK